MVTQITVYLCHTDVYCAMRGASEEEVKTVAEIKTTIFIIDVNSE